MDTQTYIQTLEARIRQLECNVQGLSEENDKLGAIPLEEKPETDKAESFRHQAIEDYRGDDIWIEPTADVSLTDEGDAWIAAWVFVRGTGNIGAEK